MYRIIKAICIITLVILFSVLFALVVLNSRNKLEYVTCNNNLQYIYTKVNYIDISREESKKEIENLFGNPKYIYIESDCEYSYCYPMLRLVVINKNTSTLQYIIDLTHELVHITEFVVNERYTSYKTFIKLYESNNRNFQVTAFALATIQHSGKVQHDYNCWYYIYEYLKNK